jgi:SAM-dependent methyltransferase
LHHQRFALPERSPLPSAYDVVACDDCSFVYADTPGRQQDYDRYYETFSKYEDPNVATGGGDSELDRQRLDVSAARLADELAARKDARILDIGCAGGGLLKALRQRGFANLTGLDPSPGCVERVRAHGMTGVHGRLSNLLHLRDLGTYDAIVLSHVLEHVVDVRQTMNALHGLIAAAGIVYVEAPDAARYVQHPFVPFYYFDTEHINHFDTASLSNLAATSRFRVVDSGQKELVVGEQQLYPAVWVILTPAEIDAAIVPSIGLRERLLAYVEQSSVRNDTALERLAVEERSIALWGAGSHSQRLLKESALGRCRIVAVVDRDRVKHGQKFAGVEIQSPEAGLSGLGPDVVIVIASVLHAKDIAGDLNRLGIRNEFIVANGGSNSAVA